MSVVNILLLSALFFGAASVCCTRRRDLWCEGMLLIAYGLLAAAIVLSFGGAP